MADVGFRGGRCGLLRVDRIDLPLEMLLLLARVRAPLDLLTTLLAFATADVPDAKFGTGAEADDATARVLVVSIFLRGSGRKGRAATNAARALTRACKYSSHKSDAGEIIVTAIKYR